MALRAADRLWATAPSWILIRGLGTRFGILSDSARFDRVVEEVRGFRRQCTIPVLLWALDLADAKQRAAAVKLLRALTGRNEKFDPNAPKTARREKVDAWRQWWEKAKNSLYLGPE